MYLISMGIKVKEHIWEEGGGGKKQIRNRRIIRIKRTTRFRFI